MPSSSSAPLSLVIEGEACGAMGCNLHLGCARSCLFPSSRAPLLLPPPPPFPPSPCSPEAYEPHSVLPLGMCVFTRWAEGMPPSLVNTHVASTSTVFLAPFVRHIVHWLGCRPASRDVSSVAPHAVQSSAELLLVPPASRLTLCHRSCCAPLPPRCCAAPWPVARLWRSAQAECRNAFTWSLRGTPRWCFSRPARGS